jgi:peptide/nickel transport system ATP-binding protein
LDVSLAANVLNLLSTLRRELGIGLVFVTHDLSAARFIADDIIVLRHGRIVEQGRADEVLARPSESYTAALVSALPEIGSRRAAS